MFAFPRARRAGAAVVYALAWLGPVGLRAEDAPAPVKIARFAPTGSVSAVGFSKNADLLACGDDYGPCYLFRIATGEKIAADAPQDQFVTVPHARVCWWTRSTLRLQDDLTDRTKTRTIQVKQLDVDMRNNYMGNVFFSRDDRLIAGEHTRDDKTLSIWDSQSGDLVARFAPPKFRSGVAGAIEGPVAFDAKNRYVAAVVPPFVYRYDMANDVVVWDLALKQEVFRESENFRVDHLAFCTNGDLVCAGIGPAKPHSRAAGEPLDNFGAIVVKRPGEPQADERKSGTTIAFRTVQRIAPSSGVMSIAFSRAGLVVGCEYQRVSLWDLATGKELCVLNDGEVANENFHSCFVAAGQNGSLIAFTNKGGIDLYRIGPDPAKK